ncbi:MAG: hypothetical protein AB1609_00740 [Bacillota bacterium]
MEHLAKTYKGKSLAPGGGGRFARMVDKLQAQGKSAESARAIAASIGRKKYGAKQMAKWAANALRAAKRGKRGRK